MVRYIVSILVLSSLSPGIAKACGADHDDQMQVQVRQTGPQQRFVRHTRPAEFIVFRGDMRMQDEEIQAERKDQMAAKARQQQAQLAATKAEKPVVVAVKKPMKLAKRSAKATRAPASIGKKIVSMD
jgi:hypothetical protein